MDLASEFQIPFFEASAKADINVQQAFSKLVEDVVDRTMGGAQKGKKGETPDSGGVALSAGGKTDKKCC